MKGLKCLFEAYPPSKILHRDQQIEMIQKLFLQIKEKEALGTALLIQGVTGSGKTATTKHILKNNAGLYLFASGETTKTACATLRALSDLDYKTEEKILNEFIEKISIEKKVVVIDEVHKIKDLNNFLQHINTIYRNAGVPIILVTNRRMFLEKMPEDVRKTLFFQKVLFPAYDAMHLYDILNDRLKEGNLGIPEETKRYICGIGAKEGSARLILRLAYEHITKKEQNIDKILNALNREEWSEVINSLCYSEKKFLRTLLKLSDNNGKKISSSELQQEFSDLSPSRISQIITGLEGYGMIKTEKVNLGRGGGRFRYISFTNGKVKETIDVLLE